jgi:hypothetical protein
VNISALINDQQLEVGENVVVCSGQDNTWTVRKICASLHPFREGLNMIRLHAKQGAEVFCLAKPHIFQLHIDRSSVGPNIPETVRPILHTEQHEENPSIFLLEYTYEFLNRFTTNFAGPTETRDSHRRKQQPFQVIRDAS